MPPTIDCDEDALFFCDGMRTVPLLPMRLTDGVVDGGSGGGGRGGGFVDDKDDGESMASVVATVSDDGAPTATATPIDEPDAVVADDKAVDRVILLVVCLVCALCQLASLVSSTKRNRRTDGSATRERSRTPGADNFATPPKSTRPDPLSNHLRECESLRCAECQVSVMQNHFEMKWATMEENGQ